MNAGLAVFVVAVVLDLMGLLLDYGLYLELGYPSTVTALVRGGNWGVGGLIIAIQVIGIIGLTYHFWGVSEE